MDESDLLQRLLRTLRESGVAFCVIGGQGVNAYAEPVVSLDLDLVLAADDVAALEPLLAREFRVERSEHSLNVSAAGSDVRVQIQLAPRYQVFLAGAESRQILGEPLPVARIEDALQGKIWVALDASRRASKRQKDLADIARLLEVQPTLRARVPQQILERLL